jgi:hypothetical protein
MATVKQQSERRPSLEELRRRIEAGEYAVRPEALAERIIRDTSLVRRVSAELAGARAPAAIAAADRSPRFPRRRRFRRGLQVPLRLRFGRPG